MTISIKVIVNFRKCKFGQDDSYVDFVGLIEKKWLVYKYEFNILIAKFEGCLGYCNESMKD